MVVMANGVAKIVGSAVGSRGLDWSCTGIHLSHLFFVPDLGLQDRSCSNWIEAVVVEKGCYGGNLEMEHQQRQNSALCMSQALHPSAASTLFVSFSAEC